MRRTTLLALTVLCFAVAAFALQPILAIHFTFDPTHTGIITSGWRPHRGAPGELNDKADHGLVLEKNGPTATNAAAGAVLTGVAGLSADNGTVGELELGFDIIDNSHCGAGAPRFNVVTTAGLFFVGCAHGTPTPAPSLGWTRVTFDCATDWFGPTGSAGCPPAGSTVVGIAIVFDEGTDTPAGGGIVTPGQTVIDNIQVNETTIDKPGAGPKRTF
jgi:hypothetical protein